MNAQSEDQKVDLNELANLAGFPVELVKKELFGQNEDSENISLADLRVAMVKYLDQNLAN